MNLTIDCREKQLLESCELLVKSNDKYSTIKIESSNLPIGDVIMNNIIIFERKTISDLLASIKDGRYAEQSYRLNGSEYVNHHIVYLIEGTADNSQKQLVYSSLCSILFFKGFSIIQTANITDSALFICNAVYKLTNDMNIGKSLYYFRSPDNSSEISNYSSVVKKVKKDNISRDNIGEIMLSQIPGVSSQTASVIMNKYKTINELIKSLDQDANCLNDLTVADSSGKSRKLRKDAIGKIVDYLISR